MGTGEPLLRPLPVAYGPRTQTASPRDPGRAPARGLFRMPLLVVGCNHQRAPLEVLERLAVSADDLPKVLHDVLALEHVTESVIISTCNRIEVYAQVTRFHPGLHEVRSWLAQRGDIHPQDLDDLQYSYHDERAAAHLFAVAGGLDSMVVGERQIASQVKQAMEVAREEGAARRVLQRLFNQAVSVGRRVRRESRIGEGASSMVDVGLAVADQRRGLPLAGARVVVLGAGELGALTARRIAELGAGHVTVWNRSQDKAERVASKLAGQVPHRVEPHLEAALLGAEVVVCTTGASAPILDAELVARALASERGDAGQPPVVLLDLGVPRNVESACAELPGIEVIDVSDVRHVADRDLAEVLLADARQIVEEEVVRFRAWNRAADVEPTIRALRGQADAVRLAELDRLRGKLATLDEDQRTAVDALTRGIVNTLLHQPTVRLKQLADLGGADPGVELLRELFDLPDDGS